MSYVTKCCVYYNRSRPPHNFPEKVAMTGNERNCASVTADRSETTRKWHNAPDRDALDVL